MDREKTGQSGSAESPDAMIHNPSSASRHESQLWRGASISLYRYDSTVILTCQQTHPSAATGFRPDGHAVTWSTVVETETGVGRVLRGPAHGELAEERGVVATPSSGSGYLQREPIVGPSSRHLSEAGSPAGSRAARDV